MCCSEERVDPSLGSFDSVSALIGWVAEDSTFTAAEVASTEAASVAGSSAIGSSSVAYSATAWDSGLGIPALDSCLDPNSGFESDPARTIDAIVAAAEVEVGASMAVARLGSEVSAAPGEISVAGADPRTGYPVVGYEVAAAQDSFEAVAEMDPCSC